MKIMLTGAYGQVGWELSRSLMPLGEIIALDRTRCDLSRPETIPAIVQEIKPDVIVNAAAYTAVDKAEEEESLARIVNGTSVGVLAEEARKHQAAMVHFSTDYVFDGGKTTPYSEEDQPNPISAYGRSKLAGEEAINQIGGDFLILRTAWVYSTRGHNFIKTILRLANTRDKLTIVDDQHGSPTWSRNIADTTSLVLAKWKVMYEENSSEPLSGIYNITAAGNTSWFEFAVTICREAICRNLISADILAEITPIPTTDYPLPASRPKNSCLDGRKLYRDFNLQMPKWAEAVKRCLDDMR